MKLIRKRKRVQYMTATTILETIATSGGECADEGARVEG